MNHSHRNSWTVFIAVLQVVTLTSHLMALDGDFVQKPPFRVHVLDEETGRGVPLVHLTTTDNQTFTTDSNGVAAIDAPGLNGERVWFSVRSEGYRFPHTDFGGRPGFRTSVVPGDSTVVEIQRTNIAKRLYRKTGRGLYVDSRKVGIKAPVHHPLLNARVMGQDSVLGVVFGNRIFWLYNDTTLPHSRFGVFKTTGATTPLSGRTPPDATRGLNQYYFKDQHGRARALLPLPGSNAVWISRLMIPDQNPRKLYAYYSRIQKKFRVSSHGIARWSKSRQRFVRVREFPLDQPFPVNRVNAGYRDTFQVRENGKNWFYFPNPYPVMRVLADTESFLDPSRYQMFTPFQHGTQSAPTPQFSREEPGDITWKRKTGWFSVHPKFDHHARGELRWTWRERTLPLTPINEYAYTKRNIMDRSNGMFHLTGADSGQRIVPGNGSVRWNPYRQKWIMIAPNKLGTSSNLGEIYYAEADSPLGPWVYARKIVTHNSHTLYNPVHHPFLNQNDGRTIFFEGTYSSSFNPGSRTVPRYNYNQVMYSLDLNDTRLYLPTPVYRNTRNGTYARYGTSGAVSSDPASSTVPFYALPPERKREETVPVWESRRKVNGSLRTVLTRSPGPFQALKDPVFYALPDDEPSNPAVEPLYQYREVNGSQITYRTPSRDPGLSWRRHGEPVTYLWRSPRIDPPRNPDARPVLTCRGSSAHCDEDIQSADSETPQATQHYLSTP